MANDDQKADDQKVDDQKVDDQKTDPTLITDDKIDQKADDQKADDKTDQKADDQKTDEASITYETFKVPEGMEIDSAALESFLPLAQAQKLSQEDAQKYVDLFAKGAERAAELQAQTWVDLKNTWETETRADKEIGGERLDESLQYAKLSVVKLGTVALSQALEITGFGNHPEFVRFFAKVGKLISDDKFDFGSLSGEGSKTHEDILFPNQGQK